MNAIKKRLGVKYIVLIIVILIFLAFNIYITYMNLYGSPIPYINSVSIPCQPIYVIPPWVTYACYNGPLFMVQKVGIVNLIDGHMITVFNVNKYIGTQVSLPFFEDPISISNDTASVALFTFEYKYSTQPYLIFSRANLINGVINTTITKVPLGFTLFFSLYIVNGSNVYLASLINRTTYLVDYQVLSNGTPIPKWVDKLSINYSGGEGLWNNRLLTSIYATEGGRLVIAAFTSESLTSQSGQYSIIVINASNGAVLYARNIFVSLVFSPAIVDGVFIFPSNGSIYGINITANKPYMYLVLRNYSGFVIPLDGPSALLIWQIKQTAYIVKFNVYGKIYWEDSFTVVEYPWKHVVGNPWGFYFWVYPLNDHAAVAVIGPGGFEYGMYGQKQVVMLLNLSNGEVIRSVVRYLRIPFINGPSPSSTEPYIDILNVYSADGYFIYTMGGSYYITNYELLLNDWLYYALFDNTMLVVVLWILWLFALAIFLCFIGRKING